MDPGNILPIVLAIFTVAGLLLAIRSQRKGAQKKVEELSQHLQAIGIKASVVEESASIQKVGQKRSWGQKSVGTIKVIGKNIDSITVVSVASQYGVHYFLDSVVRSSSSIGRENKKTRMIRKRSSGLWGKVIDIEWKGDDRLAQRLNFDYRLKEKLLGAPLKGGIDIFPEPKHEYARIRTTYVLPGPDLFEAMDIIAEHIASG